MSTTRSLVTALTRLHIAALFGSPPATARVAVTGEVDLATGPGLREALLRVLHTHGPAVLDIDLAGVTFLDCTGIRALIAVRNAAVHDGCQVRVCHPRPNVRRVLEMARLLDVLTVEPADPQHRARAGRSLSSTR